MTSQKDPVCGMTVEPGQAAGESTYGGQTFLFCSSDCKTRFDENPAHYAGDERQAGQPDVEVHEPPHLKIAGVPLPKFGSAGGGGLEREPGPETHVKDSPSTRKR